MLVDHDDPRRVLFEAADLEAGPSLRTLLSEQGLPESAADSLQRILSWARTYLARPHPELGRSGDVCPFTRPALDRGTFYLTVIPGSPAPDEVEETLAGYRDWFARLEPTANPLAQFKTILAIFPDLAPETAPALIETTQARLKPDYVAAGLMIGEFHDGPPEQGGLWNPDWRPLRSPVPLLAIRHMVPTDCLFLEHDAGLLGCYLERFRSQVPKHLRSRIDAAARNFGLEPVASPSRRRGVRDPLAGLTPEQKRAMLEELLARDPAREYPATSPQRRLWFIDQLEGQDAQALYNMPGRVSLPAGSDLAKVEAAFAHVLARHESLRTSFRPENGEPVGVVAPADDPRLAPAIPQETRTASAFRSLLAQPFQLDTPPLVRAALLRGDDADQLLLSLHHIVADDASIAQVCSEIATVYAALAADQEPDLPPVVQFGDYARSVTEQVNAGAHEPHRAYWIGRLTGAPELLPLPTARPRPQQQTFRGAAHAFHRDGVMARVDAVASRTHSTRFMVLTAALNAVLSRLSGSDDVVIGTPVAGRNAVGLESCVGMFVNTVALRTDLSGHPSLAEVLDRTKHAVVGALDHQDLPFEEVVEEVSTRTLAHSPVFQTMFVLGREDVLGGGFPSSSTDEPTVARFDLTLVVLDRGDGLDGWIDYNTDLFDPNQIRALVDRVVVAVDAMATEVDTTVDDLDLRTFAERRAHTAHTLDSDAGEDAVAMFLDRAAEQPEACAVEVLGDGASRVTYAELEQRSARVAARLRALGVRTGQVVAVDADRSTDVVAALIGVLRAGAAYLPLDPGHPTERRASLVTDSGAVAVIGEAADLSELGVPLLAYDGAAECAAPELVVSGDAPAYLIYTSGSTGTPKGVLVHRRGVAALTRQFIHAHGLRITDRLLAVPPFSFDASVGDLFPVLASGASLVLVPDPAALSLSALAGVAERHGVSAVDAAAPLWQEWVTQLRDRPDLGRRIATSGLRMVWFGGDAVPSSAVRTWLRETGISVHNHYGPTESTVCATTCTVRDAQGAGAWPTLPVGSPLPGVRVHVLDARLRPVPDGVYGEICIGGPGVAHGYLDRPGATAARFVPDPETPGQRMYRTGDIGRWGTDGRLEFAGRADQQVKIRGYRVEPGEVEGVLATHSEVSEAVVTVQDDAVTGRQLLGYVVGEADPEELRSYVAERVPAYLVPSQLVVLERLPRTTGGKLDRSALRPPSSVSEREHHEPVTETERAVADVWRDLLQVPAVSVTDSYFDLGGHSLLAGRVLARLQDSCAVDVPLRLLFAAPDLRSLAADIDRLQAGEDPIGEQVDLHAAATLPAEIRAPATAHTPSMPCRPLLTGATGFVGAHLLAELLPQVDRVHCLVRADSIEHGRARVWSTLTDYDLLDPELFDKVVVVPGDLARPRLGLDAVDWEELQHSLDAIYHVGARVSSAFGYGQLAPTNVGGTLEVLRLAATATVPVHDVSTLGVFRTPSNDGRAVRESTDLPIDPDGIIGAYEQSKWVADRLVTTAAERGLEVTVHRPARVAGSTRTGAVPAADFLPLLLRAVVDLGSAPNSSRWNLDLTPVDHLVAAVVGLSARPAGTYHYLTPAPLAFSEVVAAVRDAGYCVVEQDPDAWYDELMRAQAAGADEYAVLTQELSGRGGHRAEPEFDCTATETAIRSLGLDTTRPHKGWIRRYLDHLRARDVIPAPTTSSKVGR